MLYIICGFVLMSNYAIHEEHSFNLTLIIFRQNDNKDKNRYFYLKRVQLFLEYEQDFAGALTVDC